MFLQPQSVEEALRLKRDFRADAAFVAGGTDLVVMMNHGRALPRVLIDLSHVPGIADVALLPGEPNRNDAATWRVGQHYSAGCAATFAKCGQLPVECLAHAALSVGGPQIRNRGTLAGNIASASPAGDGSTALLALEADLELRNAEQTRTLPLCDFFVEYRKTRLESDEMITAIRFPADWRSAWFKLGKRGAMNISLVCCAAAVSPDGRFHVAFGSVGPYPMRVPKAEQYLTEALATDASAESTGSAIRLEPKVIEEACALAAGEVRPIDDFRGSADYRRAMAGASLRKVLRRLCAQV